MDHNNSSVWLDQFRKIILAYNERRKPDPFMIWFRQKDAQGFFADETEKSLAILIDARFDQMTNAEKALENTKAVTHAGCLKGKASFETLPLLIPRQYFTATSWTKSFSDALPYLKAISQRIVDEKAWAAKELCNLMQAEMKAPYMGIKTTRLAIRWLHELMPNLRIDMNSYEIPIDRLVYRVSSRLGLIDPNFDKYSGQGSDADVKIQTLVKGLLPGNQWIFDEPLWSTGRKRINNGHCYPSNPSCFGCIFGEICPKKFLDFDPAERGMVSVNSGPHIGTRLSSGSCGIPKEAVSLRQNEFAKFIAELKQKGISGEEWRGQISFWRREHPEGT